MTGHSEAGEPQRYSAKASRDGRPRVHASASVRECTLGAFCEVGERTALMDCTVGAYSYFERHCEAIHCDIGKFCAIASDVRLNALEHPMDRVSQHKFTYRPNEYFLGAKIDKAFRERRRTHGRVVLGHDVWIGHGAIVLPGTSIGDGAVIGAGAVVTRDVAPYAIVAGVPARFVRWRFAPELSARIRALAWWDWDHDRLADAVADMQALGAEAFVDKYG